MDSYKEVKLFPSGVITMPASKSAAHRAVICAGLADGESRITIGRLSQDIEATIRCMSALGTGMRYDNGLLTVKGGLKPRSGALLDCGESGSTLRFLVPLAALYPEKARFTGRGRLMQRPMTPYLNTLHKRGAEVSFIDGVLSVSGPLTAGSFELPGDISSQFVSGLLFALPLLKEDSEIVLTTPLESASYVDMTADMMARFGVSVRREKNRFIVPGEQHYRPQSLAVEADYSQAAFFLVAGALGRDVTVAGLSSDSKQGDKKIIELIKKSGLTVETTPSGLRVRGGRILPQVIDVSDIPDLVPPLAALLCFAEGESRIINAGRLKLKESDRLAAVTEELNALGAEVSMGPDRLIIRGVKNLKGGRMSSRGDHRIAMMGAVAAIRSDGPVFIEGSDSVAKSYPGFWLDFEKTGKQEGVI